ncbi:MAG: hypothetical protein WC322_03485 [Candidatus Paceibacterota bacterium]|jgi:hypothetical protein
MGFFSKKITTEKIIETLADFFDAGYGALVIGLKEKLKDENISIDENQDKELMVVSLFAVMKAILITFGDCLQTKNIIGGLQHEVFDEYFKDNEQKNKFGELFWQRCNEYSQILKPDNEDLIIQFGQIFCNNFYKKEEDGSHLKMMMLVGGLFVNELAETKKFLEEVSSKYEIV